jgi:hypothetical protein
MQTITSAGVRELFTQLRPVLAERVWRLLGAAVARLLGRFGGRESGPGGTRDHRSWDGEVGQRGGATARGATAAAPRGWTETADRAGPNVAPGP